MSSITVAGSGPGPRAGRKEWIGLAVLALPTLLLSLDMSVLYLALQHLAADLRPTSTQTLWIVDIYGFMIAGFLITMGTLGDRIGRRKLLMIGGTAFGIASVIAAYSTSAEMLIATRALLGVAGATLMPSTLALISNMFRNPTQRSTAIAVWLCSFMVGIAIGPVIGGVLLEFFWWGSVFLLGVPVMAVLLIAAPILLPEFKDADAGRIDLTSVALSLATILPIIYGIKELAREGFGLVPVAAMAAGLVVGVVFVRRQLTLASPLLDFRLFRERAFSAAVAVMMLGAVSMGGVFLFVTQYLQLVEGLSPLRAGLWLVPPALVMIASTMAAPNLARRSSPGVVIAAAFGIATVGFLMLTQASSTSGLWLLIPAIVVIYIGLGPTGALVTDLIVGSAPPEKAGSASAISETSAELGIALGVGVLGSIGTAVYRTQLDGAMPDGLTAGQASASRDTFAGALASAEQLPGEIGAALLAGAEDAFASGLNVVAAVSVGISVLLAVLAVTMLRIVEPASEGVDAEDAHSVDDGVASSASPGRPVVPRPAPDAAYE